MKKIISISIALAIISSCTTSNQVVSSKMFQKRKYQKGWHINNSKKLDKSTEVNKNEAVAQNEDYESEQNNVSVVTETQKAIVYNTAEVLESNFEQTVIASSFNNLSSPDLGNSINQISEEITLENFDFEGDVSEENQETQVVSAEENLNSNSSSGVEWYFWVLALFIPWLAVGIVTNWDVETVVINILWTLLCGIPGIIHAFIILNREG